MTASPPSRTCCLRRPPANFPARNASAMSRSLQPWNNAALQLKGITNPGIGRPLGCGAAGHRSPCSAPPRTGHLETGLPTISAGLCAGPRHVPTSQRDRGHQALIRAHSTARATGSTRPYVSANTSPRAETCHLGEPPLAIGTDQRFPPTAPESTATGSLSPHPTQRRLAVQ